MRQFSLALLRQFTFIGLLLLAHSFKSYGLDASAPAPQSPPLASEHLIYHDIQTDPHGLIVPWYNPDPAISYDHVIQIVWNFWSHMNVEENGLPYYMNHQVWKEHGTDIRGLGGDQLQMALSSWRLLYAYSGDEAVKQNMKFIADYYISHSLSPLNSFWPDLPYPYNTVLKSGNYDGDMMNGPNVLQPDKAGSLGLELIDLYELTANDLEDATRSHQYLQVSVRIARSLMQNLKDGDETSSPLPFKVNALTGETVHHLHPNDHNVKLGLADYSTNLTSTMEMFLKLEKIDPSRSAMYHASFVKILNWMKTYPMATNKWGPFFEDIPAWSETQINATTFARFILEHREYFPNWRSDVTKIFDWVYATLGNDQWKSYGVSVTNEQTEYRVPGQSHSSRQGSTELLYCSLSGDLSRKDHAIRQLNWSTYMVDFDGKNRFPQDEVWLTDGYGDYVRHYIRAMAAFPELAPKDQPHILSSSSTVQKAVYLPHQISYRTFDTKGVEKIRLPNQPRSASSGKIRWVPLANGGGWVEVERTNSNHVVIRF